MNKIFWKTIPGYTNYQASNTGLIRSVDRTVKFKNRWGQVIDQKLKGKILKIENKINGAGYYGCEVVDSNSTRGAIK